MGKTLRKDIEFAEGSTPVSGYPAIGEKAAKTLDELNEGQQDFLQAGVVESTDWSFTATINSGTGALGSGADTGGKAWLPDPVVSGALMRTVTSSAALSGLAPTLPSSGKYVGVAFELTAATWGASATVSVHTGAEKSSQAEAEAAYPATTSGKAQIRRVVIHNTSGVYSIAAQSDARVYALNGKRLAVESVGTEALEDEAVTGPKLANEAVTGPKLGTETVRMLAASKYSAYTLGEKNKAYTPSATRPTMVVLFVTGSKETEPVQAKIMVGGVLISDIYFWPAGNSWYIPFSFICPPGVSWEVESTTVNEPYYSYLTL